MQRFLLVWLLPFVLSAQTVTIAVDSTIGKPPAYFGFEGTWVNEDSALFLERYRMSGLNAIRLQFPMFKYESQNDDADPATSQINFNRDFTLDKQLGKHTNYHRMLRALLRQRPNLNVYINIWECANWLASTPGTFFGGVSGAFPPTDYREYQEVVRSIAGWIVRQLNIAPERLLFSFVNEPNSNSSFPTHAFIGNTTDLLKMAQAARLALDEVSPKIRLGGLEEINNVKITEKFFAAGGGKYLDFITFHVYRNNYRNLNTVISEIVNVLKRYNKPVHLTELGNNQYGEGYLINYSPVQAGYSLMYSLMHLWQQPIEGFVMFRFSNSYYGSGHAAVGGWKGYGVFEDWRGTHSNRMAYHLFSAYWVFANFYQHMTGGRIVKNSHAAPALSLLAVRGESHLAIAAIHSDRRHGSLIDFAIDDPEMPDSLVVGIIDGLNSATTATSTIAEKGRFRHHFPARSIRFFLLEYPQK